MNSAGEWQQEVHRHRPVGHPPSRRDLLAQITGREEPDRAQAARRRHRPRELPPGKAAAHAGLDDRELDAGSFQQLWHGLSIAKPTLTGQSASQIGSREWI